MEDRSYKAIFFDLDGTLLPMDVEEFLKEYGIQLGKFFAAQGFDDPQGLVKKVFKCTAAMCDAHDGLTNKEAFWAAFEKLSGMTQEFMEPKMYEFYRGIYNEIAADLPEFPQALKVVRLLQEKGYPLYLTTMPLFPTTGVAQRLSWVGLCEDDFERMTTYSNSSFVKPSLDYYQENLSYAGLKGEDVLVVGNNTSEDLAAMELGCDAFLVTDMMIDPVGFDLSQVRHGSFDDFVAFAESLPECELHELDFMSLLEMGTDFQDEED
ncbi:MAG: HAD hydrolase-like protein [Coriobacteriia bacterium]|mgnify:CR=1 FL=1|nr:HAD hydrolase-like protein [Coriobacteriia bacterium]